MPDVVCPVMTLPEKMASAAGLTLSCDIVWDPEKPSEAELTCLNDLITDAQVVLTQIAGMADGKEALKEIKQLRFTQGAPGSGVLPSWT
jgi:hypothetical protein